MIVELNIGLPPGTSAAAIMAAGLRIGHLTTEVLSRTQEVGYQGPHGPVQETVLVVRACFSDALTSDTVIDALAHDYCRLFGQDYVAVCLPDFHIGTLIGPKAAERGAFDINKFVPYVVAEKQQEQKKID